MNWQSSEIPTSIRRPWQIFEEDLQYKISDLEASGEDLEDKIAEEDLRDRLAHVRGVGSLTAFLQLPGAQQRAYAEVSLAELSAYVSWLRAVWNALDNDAKYDWVPECSRSCLATNSCWAPLLADGLPPCGAVDIETAAVCEVASVKRRICKKSPPLNKEKKEEKEKKSPPLNEEKKKEKEKKSPPLNEEEKEKKEKKSPPLNEETKEKKDKKEIQAQEQFPAKQPRSEINCGTYHAATTTKKFQSGPRKGEMMWIGPDKLCNKCYQIS